MCRTRILWLPPTVDGNCRCWIRSPSLWGSLPFLPLRCEPTYELAQGYSLWILLFLLKLPILLPPPLDSAHVILTQLHQLRGRIGPYMLDSDKKMKFCLRRWRRNQVSLYVQAINLIHFLKKIIHWLTEWLIRSQVLRIWSNWNVQCGLSKPDLGWIKFCISLSQKKLVWLFEGCINLDKLRRNLLVEELKDRGAIPDELWHKEPPLEKLKGWTEMEWIPKTAPS